MSEVLPDALKLFVKKRSVPTELVTKDISILDVWMKERAFWMAGVADAEILQAFRREAENIIGGKSGQVESINRLMLFLEGKNYEPPPGTEGTIKDLSTWRRMSVALDMNVRMMRGYGRWLRAQRTLRAFPAWEFIRVAPRKVHRDWPPRWEEAVAKSAGVPGVGDNVALINHPVWGHLSAFGSPYPPFDWGSGMGVKLVSRSKAKKLGLLDDPRTERMWKEPAVASPNATLQAKPDVSEESLRDALSNRLKGLARWDGDTLIHTDPNGTRPATQTQLIDMWSNLPEEIEPRQERSFIEWVKDSSAFQEDKEFTPGSDQWDDMVRLADRLEPIGTRKLYRGVIFTNKINLDKFLKLIQEKGYESASNLPAGSWSIAPAILNIQSGDKKWAVQLEVQSPKQGRDISSLVSHYSDKIGKKNTPSGSDFILPRGLMMDVISVKRDTKKRIIKILLKERK